ncbi:MAG: PorV/PorQ family protein [Candidatus Eiseniibacteriota bacterium]
MRRLVLAGLFLGAVGLAADASAQTTAAISLSIPPTGRANGMGQAFVAVADDGTATWWNPGGLGLLPEKKDGQITYSKLVPDLADDVAYIFPSFTFPVKTWGTFGASIVYLNYGTSTASSETGELGQDFTSYEVAPTLSYGTKVMDGLGVGASFKYIRVDLAPAVAGLSQAAVGTTFAFDLGALYKVPGDMVNVGLTVQNLGPNISFIAPDRNDAIFRNLKAGVAVNAYNKNAAHVLVAADVNQLLVKFETTTGEERFPKPIWNGGVEAGYQTSVNIAVRAGYVYDDDGDIKDPTFGLGIGYRGFEFDYASIPQASGLDRVSKFSLGAQF